MAFAVPPSKELTAAERLRLKAAASSHHHHAQPSSAVSAHHDDRSSVHGHSSHNGRESHHRASSPPSSPSKRDKKPPQFASGAGCDRLELPRLLAEVASLVPGACPDVAGLIALQVYYGVLLFVTDCM